MTEYKAQMCRKNGKWVDARFPNIGNKKIVYSYSEACEHMRQCKTAWADYDMDMKTNYPSLHDESLMYTEFRVVSREVTAWR